VSEGAAAANARPQVGCFGGDLHARSRADAQHPAWVLPDRGARSVAADLRVGLEPTCWSGVIRQNPVGDRQILRWAVVIAPQPPTSMRENPSACRRARTWLALSAAARSVREGAFTSPD